MTNYMSPPLLGQHPSVGKLHPLIISVVKHSLFFPLLGTTQFLASKGKCKYPPRFLTLFCGQFSKQSGGKQVGCSFPLVVCYYSGRSPWSIIIII